MTYDPTRYWQERASTQGPTYVGPGGKPDRTARQSRLFADVLDKHLPTVHTLLDYGCGSGRFAELLSGYCAHYIGADIAPAALEYARQAWPTGDFRLIEDGALPVASASVDLVVTLTVLQHIVHPDDFQCAVSEIKRVLRPGGRVFCVEEWYDERAMHEHVTCRRAKDYLAVFGGTFQAVGRVATARAFWLTPGAPR